MTEASFVPEVLPKTRRRRHHRRHGVTAEEWETIPNQRMLSNDARVVVWIAREAMEWRIAA